MINCCIRNKKHFYGLEGYHMDKKLYDLMDWAGVEAIVYSEEDHPEKYLGPHQTEDGIAVQAFFPDAKGAAVVLGSTGKRIRWIWKMKQDILQHCFPSKRIPDYSFTITYENSVVEGQKDPYSFPAQITEKEAKKSTQESATIYTISWEPIYDDKGHGRRLLCSLGAERHARQRRRGFQSVGRPQAADAQTGRFRHF